MIYSRNKNRRGARRWHSSCRTLSVVIPAKNEAAVLGPCIKAILGAPHVIEAIVVDGGSRDETCSIARAAGARVIVHTPSPASGWGRGGQIRTGIYGASGDVVAIVHADARVAPRTFSRMIRVLNARDTVIGGSAGCRFHGKSNDWAWHFRLKIIEFLNHARTMVSGISFGDQVQFFRREPVVTRDLFPNIPLMEDVEFAIQMRCLGDLVYLNEKVAVSTRRWEKQGSGNALLIMALFFVYLLRRPWGQPDTTLFYKRYYKKHPNPTQ